TRPRLHLSQLMCRRIRSSIVISSPWETAIVCHEVMMWQAVTGSRVIYLQSTEALRRMSPASRASKVPVALYQAVGPAGKTGSKLRRAGELSLPTPGLDLATKLRVFQRALRSRVERRDALLDISRAVSATLEPTKVAELVVERAATWIPAPCWA